MGVLRLARMNNTFEEAKRDSGKKLVRAYGCIYKTNVADEYISIKPVYNGTWSKLTGTGPLILLDVYIIIKNCRREYNHLLPKSFLPNVMHNYYHRLIIQLIS